MPCSYESMNELAIGVYTYSWVISKGVVGYNALGGGGGCDFGGFGHFSPSIGEFNFIALRCISTKINDLVAL